MAGMESGGQSVMDLLHCPACTAPYDSHTHTAKLLHCHHSVCLACAAQLSHGKPYLRCPQCQKKTKIPSDGIASLGDNIYVTQMQSLVAASPKVTQDASNESKSNGTKLVTTTAENVSSCEKHVGQPLLFYCQTCSTTICISCTVLDHNKGDGHEVQDVACAAKAHYDLLKTCMQGLDQAYTSDQHTMDVINSEMNQLEICRTTAENQVKTVFEQLILKLEQKQDSLTEEIQTLHSNRKQQLMKQRTNTDAHQEQVSKARTYLDNTIQRSDIHAVIKLTEDTTTMTKLESLTKPYKLKIDKNFIQFDYSAGLEKFIESLQSIGLVKCANALPVEVQIESSKLTSGVKSSMKVVCKDAAGKGLVDYPITVEITDPCKDNIAGQLAHRENGIYALQTRPQMPGKHQIQAFFQGKPMWRTQRELIASSNNPVLVIGGKGELHHPTSVAIGPNGQIFVADMGNKQISVFDHHGKAITKYKISSGSTTTYDIAINSATEEVLYTRVVTDETGRKFANSVRVLSLKGEQKHQFGVKTLQKGLFLTVSLKGRIIITDCAKNTLSIFSKEGNLLKEVGSTGQAKGQFDFPSAVCTTPTDNIVVCDTNNHRIQILSKNGTFLHTFGREGNGKGLFKSPRGLAVDQTGNILVSDSYNRIQVFDKDGTFLACIDSQGDKLDQPYNMAATHDGHVMVADFNNNCVKKYRYM